MLLQTLADYGAREADSDLPEQVVHHAKRAVLDWFSALYPGTRLPPGPQLIQAHREELGVGHASLPGQGTTAFAATAAWINGSTSHAAEFDDIYRDAAFHPGVTIVPAALAVAQTHRRSGTDFLRAVIVGYEISTRLGAAVQPAHYRYFHTTGTIGCLGGAAAASLLMAPGRADVMLHALATAATFASGLQQAFRSDAMTKTLHAGHAASVGVRAAEGASHGVTGVPDILEGPAGLGAAMAGSPDWSQAVLGLGTDYHITRVTQKNHGCCGHTFSPLDAALLLRAEHGIAPDDIARVHVRTYRAALDVAGHPDPQTAFEAKFSLPYVLAHALIHGSVRLDAFLDDRLQDADTRRLMQRVQIEEDPELTARFPRRRSAHVEIELKDGSRHRHFAPDRKGDPEAPLSDDELNAKFDELASPVLGAEAASRLREQLWRLERLGDMRELARLHG